jgi:Transglutaminase-like superfamily
MLANAAAYTHIEPLLEGDAGTAQTIAWIRRLVEQGKKDRLVNWTTGRILRDRGVPGYHDEAEIRAIFDWVLRNIRFTRDPTGKELLREARTILQWGFGDCDDINAILLPSMLESVGHNTRIVTIASHPGAPEQFTHVYAEVWIRGRGWVPIDAARRDTKFGVAPSRHFRKRVWSLDSDAYQDLRGLGCGRCGGNCTRCGMRRLGSHYRLGQVFTPSPQLYQRRYRASGLGQFDWGSFTDILDSAGKATSSIIAAARAPIAPYPVVYPSMPGYPPIGPQVPPGGGIAAAGTISKQTLLLGGGLLAVLLLARR